MKQAGEKIVRCYQARFHIKFLYRDATQFTFIGFNAHYHLKTELSSATKFRDKAANDLFPPAVSKIRQSIESLFNWLIEKPYIQRASKVWSTKGLMVYVFARLAPAHIFLNFNS